MTEDDRQHIAIAFVAAGETEEGELLNYGQILRAARLVGTLRELPLEVFAVEYAGLA